MRRKYRLSRNVMLLHIIVGSVIMGIPLCLLGYYFEQLNFLTTGVLSGLFISIVMIIPTTYIIDNNTLIIREIFIAKTKIDISTIKKIKASVRGHDIKIRYKKYKQVTLYPKDKYGFINDLKSINSDIEVI